MDRKKIDKVKQKLLEINETISSLDPEIRAAAFDILAHYYFDDIPRKKPAKKLKKEEEVEEEHFETGDMNTFFSAHEHEEPQDNVKLIVAWLYQQHGVIPITRKMIEGIGTKMRLTIPKRPDNTMRQATEKGKSLFYKQASGWELTVSGEKFIKETYGVTKGKKPLDALSDSK